MSTTKVSRFRVSIAMRSRAFPHVDTTATYHIAAVDLTTAITEGIAQAKHEGMPITAIRRVSASLARTVAP